MNRIFYFILSLALITSGCIKEKKDRMTVSAVEGISTVFCDVEILSEDGKYILSSDSNIRLNPAFQRSDSISHSGKYSIKLTKEFPYGFTIEIDKIKKNEIIKADCWCYGFEPQLVFCDSGNVYYYVTDKIIETDSAGWKKQDSDSGHPEIFTATRLRYMFIMPGRKTDTSMISHLKDLPL